MLDGNAEFQMISLARGPILLGRGRTRLSRTDENAAVSCLGRSLEPEKEREFRQALRIIFQRLLEIDLHRLRQTSSASFEHQMQFVKSHSSHMNDDPLVSRTRKFMTVASSELKKVYTAYRSIRSVRPASETDIAKFFRALRRNPKIFGLLEFVLKETSGQRLRGCFSASRQSELFESLDVAFKTASVWLSASQKSGPSDPVMEQMARALGSLFLHATGEPPGRSNDAISDNKQVEGGCYLELCRTIARAINEALPQHLRRPETPDMVKVARRMINELKGDLKAP